MLRPLSAEDAQRFGDVLQAAEYTAASLEHSLGTDMAPPPHHPQFSHFLQQTEIPTPFNILTRLFFLGSAVKAEEARAVLPSWFCKTCLDSHLLIPARELLGPTALIVPCGNFLVAADLQLPGDADTEDYVLPVNQPSRHLLNFTIRRPVERTLDLCSGSALHGLDASKFSQRVVASDLSPRAEIFGRFNAALNRCPNLEFVSGDLFSAVADQRFDLILSNPPFVISPKLDATYRDNPQELDNFVRGLLQQAPEHLQEGGYLQMVCEWVEVSGEDWQARLRGWLQDRGCDVWVLQANRQRPDSYAQGRLRETGSDSKQLEKSHRAWLKYFQENSVEAIYGGLIFLRRRQGGQNWFEVDQLTSNVQHAVGEAIQQGFRNRDLLHDAAGNEALLSSRLRIAPGLSLEDKSHWQDGAWRLDSLVLRVEKDLPVAIGIDNNVRGLLERFDGGRSVAEAIDDFASHLGMPLGDIREKCIEIVRMLVANSCLLA
ncbi:MAG: class I SAM-dependent methyltransferase [Planctomycetales bacterium]|nr:class I SAM-dependent methyltransferase [Planctomycetales bacterium]